jgi:hypothetical protein
MFPTNDAKPSCLPQQHLPEGFRDSIGAAQQEKQKIFLDNPHKPDLHEKKAH